MRTRARVRGTSMQTRLQSILKGVVALDAVAAASGLLIAERR